MVDEPATVAAGALIEVHTVAVIVAHMKVGVGAAVAAILTTMIPATPAAVPDTAIETELMILTRNLIDQ